MPEAVLDAPVDTGVVDISTPDIGTEAPETTQVSSAADIDARLEELFHPKTDAAETDATHPALRGTEPETTEKQPEAAVASVDEPFPLSQDGLSYLVPKADFAGVRAAQDYAQQVQQWFPTADEAKGAFAASTNSTAFYNDLMHGGPQDIDALLNHLSGADHANMPDVQAKLASGFARMANQMPNVLEKLNPQAYGTLESTFVDRIVRDAYARAKASNDPNDISAAKFINQWSEWYKTGQYSENPTAPQPAQLASQPKQIDSREAAVSAREKALFDRDFGTFSKTELDGPKWTAVNDLIDKALEPVKASFPERTFKATRNQIAKDVNDEMLKDQMFSDTHISERANIARAWDQAWRNGKTADLKKDIAAWSNRYLARVRQVLPSIAQAYLGDAAKVNTGAKATATAAKSATPKPQHPVPTQQKKPIDGDELYQQVWDNAMKRSLAIANGRP